MTNITPINRPRPPDQDVIDFLEGILNQAKKGEIIGLTGLFFYRDREFWEGLVGEIELISTIGKLKILERRILGMIDEQDT